MENIIFRLLYFFELVEYYAKVSLLLFMFKSVGSFSTLEGLMTSLDRHFNNCLFFYALFD